MKKIALFILFAFSTQTQALEYINKSHDLSDIAVDQGVVFLGHTIGYLATQSDTIREEGSWEDYKDRLLTFEFDNDNTAWNFVGHTYTGAQVYLYYRARGYVESKAFFYSFLSSLYFEVFIENYTENASFQDTFHTPFFGSSLGYVMERVSVNLINSESTFNYYLGRLINPFSYLVDSKDVSFTPYIDNKGYALLWSVRI